MIRHKVINGTCYLYEVKEVYQGKCVEHGKPVSMVSPEAKSSESAPIAKSAYLGPISFITEAKSGSNDIPTYEDPEAVVVSHTTNGLPIWYLTHVIIPEGQHS